MGALIPFPRAHRDTLEVSPHGELFWRVIHVRVDGQRLSLGDFLDAESATNFAYRTAFHLGRTRVIVSGEALE